MIIAIKNLIVNGKKVKKGEEVKGVSKQEVEALLRIGSVEKVKKVEKKAK